MNTLVYLRDLFSKYKYLITLVAFLLLIGVIDKNSWWKRYKNQTEISRLKTEIKDYQEQYKRDLTLLNEINSNEEALEKVAREKYLMKKENEDVFLFEEE